jgi:hypothetical protein
LPAGAPRRAPVGTGQRLTMSAESSRINTRHTQERPAGPSTLNKRKPRLWEQLARRNPEVDAHAGVLVGT